MGIKPILLSGLSILFGNRDFICVSPTCNGSPGSHEVLGYQNPAHVKGTNNNHYLSNTHISVIRSFTCFSCPTYIGKKKKRKKGWNKYKPSMDTGNPIACKLWQRDQDRKLMRERVVFGDVPQEWPALLELLWGIQHLRGKSLLGPGWGYSLTSPAYESHRGFIWSHMPLIAATQAKGGEDSTYAQRTLPFKQFLMSMRLHIQWLHTWCYSSPLLLLAILSLVWFWNKKSQWPMAEENLAQSSAYCLHSQAGPHSSRCHYHTCSALKTSMNSLCFFQSNPHASYYLHIQDFISINAWLPLSISMRSLRTGSQ